MKRRNYIMRKNELTEQEIIENAEAFIENAKDILNRIRLVYPHNHRHDWLRHDSRTSKHLQIVTNISNMIGFISIVH